MTTPSGQPSVRGAQGFEQRSLVKSAARTVQVLELLADSPTRLTLSQIQSRSRIPRSSLYALISTLRKLRWIEGDEAEIAFGLGTGALLCGTSYLDHDPAVRAAIPMLEELRVETGYAAHFGRLQGTDVVHLASRGADHLPANQVGRLRPAYQSAMGQVLLAELTDDEAADRVVVDPQRVAPNTLVEADEITAAIEAVRRTGYAVDLEQSSAGLAGVAVAIGYRVPACDAIGVSMPADRARGAELTRVRSAVVAQASVLTRQLRREGVR